MKDFYSRLPLNLLFADSGIDYCTEYSQGEYTINEMQKGWQSGDIVWSGGFLSIIYVSEKISQHCNVMIIGYIEKDDLKLIKSLPREALLEFISA